MKKYLSFFSTMIILLSCSTKQNEKIMDYSGLYPKSKKTDHTDVYFGRTIYDPYQWLENDTSAETADWVKAQNQVTSAYLDSMPYRVKIKERLTKLWNYPKFSVPFREGENYFFYKNTGLQPQSILYHTKDLKAEAEVFLDPNKLSDDGTVALAGLDISNDGKYAAYGIARSGSDWTEYHVMEVSSGKKLDDQLNWIKFSGIAWYKNGFYYSRYNEPSKGKELSQANKNHKVYYHQIGTKQQADKLVYEDSKNPNRTWGAGVTNDEKFLFISGSESTNGNNLMFKDLSANDKNFKTIYPDFGYDFEVIDNLGDELLIKTNYKAPNYRLISVNTKNYKEENWKEIIPQRNYLMQSVNLAGGKMIVGYMKDVSSRVFVFDYNGKEISEIKLPGIGTCSGFSGKKEDNIAFYSFTSFLSPSTIYSYYVNSNSSEVFKKSEIDFKFDDYETRQVFCNSKDGTKIPIFITSKKGIRMNGKNPVLLYGYGGFNISLTPSFSISNLVFLENGGVYARVNLRGGGEYGEEWHKAGMKNKKQNVFDDFIAAAEYLIDQKYTSPSKLAIRGGSNGGLLVGAVMMQRPELFKVALPAVGVMDMLKYHKFTIGWAWADEYGSSDDSLMFNYLLKYSPYHNIQERQIYPATLVTTADHDDRVVPAHSFKFIAALQAAASGRNPVLIRIETKAGHSAGKPTAKVIEEYTDMWTFVFRNLDISPIY